MKHAGFGAILNLYDNERTRPTQGVDLQPSGDQDHPPASEAVVILWPNRKGIVHMSSKKWCIHTHKVKIHKGLGIKQVIDGLKPHTLPSLLNMLSNFLVSPLSEILGKHAVLNLANYDSPSPMGLGKNRLSLDSNLTLSHPCSIRRLNPRYLLKSEQSHLKLYDVEVVQFWRGEEEPLRPYPLHWAIYVETSPGIGNTYQLVGNRKNYAIDIRLSQPLENSEDLRGSYSVGSVSWAELAEMETILLRVDIIHDAPWWNGQDWVDDALRYLKCWGFSGIIEETQLAWLQDKMCWLLEGCDGIQNAVEFVGDSGDLACVLSNQRNTKAHRNLWKYIADIQALIDEATEWLAATRAERS